MSGPSAWVDLNGDKKLSPRDPVQAFGVVVAGRLGKGRFVVFGDDAIFQNRFLTPNPPSKIYPATAGGFKS